MKVWRSYLSKEIEQAKTQGNADIIQQGLVLAVRKDGNIVCRGIGAPPWKQIVTELNTKPSNLKD
jgi:hypothetical protein